MSGLTVARIDTGARSDTYVYNNRPLKDGFAVGRSR
jgi:hypothetical protein